jgi:hypothetical protein
VVGLRKKFLNKGKDKLMKRFLLRPKVFALVTFFFIFVLTGVTAQATQINYSFAGTGSGSIDSTSFSDKLFKVSINAVTDDVMFQPSLGANGILNLTGAIEIDSIGLVIFSDPLFVFGGNPFNEIGFGNDMQGNLIAISVSGVDTYDLKSDFGPVTGTNYNLNQFQNVTTNLGALTYTEMSPATFVATLSSPVTSVHEPATVLLVGSALLGLVRLKRKLRK